jgi:hypothetical protein
LKLHFCSCFVFFQMLELGTGSSEIEDKLLMVRRKCFNFPILVESLIWMRNHWSLRSYKFALKFYGVCYTSQRNCLWSTIMLHYEVITNRQENFGSMNEGGSLWPLEAWLLSTSSFFDLCSTIKCQSKFIKKNHIRRE